MGLVILCVGIGIVYYIIVIKRYKESTYYKDTKLPYFAMRYDVGRLGEYLTYKYLRKYEEEGAKFLFNCYLDKDNGETTEVDVIMIHKSGIFVFESKNYSGWIFGEEKNKNWTQTLPQGKKSHKEHFLNPILQNKLHIKWLKIKLNNENLPIHSIIVFSERCTLKKINVISPEIHVIKRNNIASIINQISVTYGEKITQIEINSMYDELYPHTQVGQEIRDKHVQNIESRTNSDSESYSVKEDIGEKQICPLCGKELVLRITKRGVNAGKEFYGCKGYPQCRYIKK